MTWHQIITTAPFPTPWAGRLPLCWLEAGFFQDWITYLDTENLQAFLTRLTKHTPCSWPAISNTHKDALTTTPTQAPFVGPFYLRVPHTLFIDLIDGLEWNEERQAYVRVFLTPANDGRLAPNPNQSVLLAVLARHWLHYGRRALGAKAHVDFSVCYLRAIGVCEDKCPDVLITPACAQSLTQTCATVASMTYLGQLARAPSERDGFARHLSTYRAKSVVNMKFTRPWHSASFLAWKASVARETGEWTLLPYLSLQVRQMLEKDFGWQTMRSVPHGIIAGSQECVCQSLLARAFPTECAQGTPTVQKRYLNHMVKVQTCPRASCISRGAGLPIVPREAFVDFEWIPSYTANRASQLYLIGAYVPSLKEYRAFWIPYLHVTEEMRLFERVQHWLRDELHVDRIVYYFAERKFLTEWQTHHVAPVDTASASQVARSFNDFLCWWDGIAVDAYDEVLRGPFVVKGSLTGKLKHLHRALYDLKRTLLPPLDVQCPNIQDGMDSVRQAKTLYWRPMTGQKALTSAERLSVRAELETYNRFDCMALSEVCRVMHQDDE